MLRRALSIAGDYLELCKPRIAILLLITTFAAMIMAARGLPSLPLIVWTLLGGALASFSAGAYNCVYDADIDALMRRTCERPIPTGKISRRNATIFATILGLIAFAMLYVLVNPLAAWLSLVGNLYYVFVYTMWLKRRTPLNIVIGGAAGSVPPLVGWAAVTGHVGAPAIGLFVLIFLWTPPHFWALSLFSESDYEKAGIPMLPNVSGEERTKREIISYTIIMVLASLLLYPMQIMGIIFFIAASLLGAWFIVGALRTWQDATTVSARHLFRYSLIYLALICVAMVIDRLVA
ncbi:MAG: heme o synthase [Vulcanimicrobiaceae bacterium]